MRIAQLVEYYRRLPDRRDGEVRESWAVRIQEGLEGFQQQVAARYSEGTLGRMLACPDSETRQAAVLALGLVGSISSNRPLAARLQDKDPQVRRLAADSLWALWFRADSPANNQELQILMRQRDAHQALDGFGKLIQKSPNFAEAYNQRAIVWFRLEEYHKSIADCEKTLKLNPSHFGAQGGIGQCYMKLRKPRAALRAFRQALRLNPNMEGIVETIRSLEDALGEEGKKEDK